MEDILVEKAVKTGKTRALPVGLPIKSNYILGIETSCDETAAAVVENGRTVLSNVIHSQIDLHRAYGGVVPEIASRAHLEKISFCVDKALEESGKALADINAVAVTYGPGLVGALLTGLSYAKGLALALGVPLIGVNHIEGHICANYIDNSRFKPPFLCLVASGGHTALVIVRGGDSYEVVGQTTDDAAGEAFDKAARALGLSYPGGPAIDEAARTASGNRAINFPRPRMSEDNFDFSFSGLKSAVLNYINKEREREARPDVPETAAAFQEAVVDVLTEKTVRAALHYKIKKVALSGGVSANSALRARMRRACKENGLTLYLPDTRYCTDNAVMIATRSYFDYCAGKYSDFSLNAAPGLRLARAGE
ncbi:MAG: tRNA (adenosine(37)-N6)-threonylcarbamoyltransferase complex transferase subunit TsaD [Clostridiales bacterium]|jgi:N6-L-threonylcarbamoyladenine synthase|nr:tRNA (adenosine(37)-N6)-threonylcarbamoyltransferase complex transferase subunit TsaD [Clostridiales bacterium]